jgi:hypothetical protein
MFDVEESIQGGDALNDQYKSSNSRGKSVQGGGGGNMPSSIYQMSKSAYNDIMNYNKKRQKAPTPKAAPQVQYAAPQVKYVAPAYNYIAPDYLYKQALLDYSEQAYNNKLKNILYEQEKNDLLHQLKKLKETNDVKGTLEELLKDEETAKKLLVALGEIQGEHKKPAKRKPARKSKTKKASKKVSKKK